LSINYFDLGKLTGEMAVQVLNGKAISELPVLQLEEVPLVLHLGNAEDIGLTFPEELLEQADRVIDN